VRGWEISTFLEKIMQRGGVDAEEGECGPLCFVSWVYGVE